MTNFLGLFTAGDIFQMSQNLLLQILWVIVQDHMKKINNES